MFKCDVYAQILDDQTQKDLWVFYFFLKWFYTFVFLVFVQNAFLCFSPKIGSEAVSQKAFDLEKKQKNTLKVQIVYKTPMNI